VAVPMGLEAAEVVFFDAYGTLFDVQSIAGACARVAPGDAEAFTALWRSKQLEYSFLRTILGRYEGFWAVTGAALDYTAERYGLALTAGQRAALLDAWLGVDPYAEVPAALAALTDRPLGVLSNGEPRMLEELLARHDLRGRFRWVLSVDEVRAYKPAPAVYELVERHTGVDRRSVLFLSSNGFDVAGASAFGFRVCWVNRAAGPLDRLGFRPDAEVRSLAELPGLLAAG